MSASKRLKSKERRGLLDEAKAALKGLTMERLINMRFEVGRELNRQMTHANDLRIRLDAVRSEISEREETWDGYRITDHAVVRYLERHKGLDIAAVRTEIADMVKASKGIDLQDGRPDRGVVRHGNLAFGVDPREDSAAVTTVFHEEEMPVMKVITNER